MEPRKYTYQHSPKSSKLYEKWGIPISEMPWRLLEEINLNRDARGIPLLTERSVISHRTDGPALIFYEHNIKVKELWREYHIPHRADGPSCVRYDNEGRIISTAWWIHGIDRTIEIREWLLSNECGIPQNFEEWDAEHKFLFKMIWG